MAVQITKRPVTVTAERYGDPATGAFDPGAVRRIATFMLGHEPVDEAEILDVVRPTATWNDDSSLEILDETIHHAWLPVALGDWVIRGVAGEFYPCADVVLQASYTIDAAA